MMKDASYLGDGVYVYSDGYHVWLVTGSHDHPDNKVALDSYVLDAFMKWLERTKSCPLA